MHLNFLEKKKKKKNKIDSSFFFIGNIEMIAKAILIYEK